MSARPIRGWLMFFCLWLAFLSALTLAMVAATWVFSAFVLRGPALVVSGLFVLTQLGGAFRLAGLLRARDPRTPVFAQWYLGGLLMLAGLEAVLAGFAWETFFLLGQFAAWLFYWSESERVREMFAPADETREPAARS